MNVAGRYENYSDFGDRITGKLALRFQATPRGYQFNFLGVSLGVRNLFDTYPDKASDTNSFGIFPWAAASPFGYNGRFLYVRSEVLIGR